MFTSTKLALVLAAMVVASNASAAPKLVDSKGNELNKREATIKLLNKERVLKCSEVELTNKMTMKSKTDEKE